MNAKILWADDEIDLLKPHILFLEEKGYEVVTVNNGVEAAEAVEGTHFDVIFLDENMPGITGLETLSRIKRVAPHVPVIMITKSEEEHIMEEAIGGKISDYLIKPVNPNQILLSLKKNLDKGRLMKEHTQNRYQVAFRELSMRIGDRMDPAEWTDLYRQLVHWELELSADNDSPMQEIFLSQKQEANERFCDFVEDNYEDWVAGEEDAPLLSHQVVSEKLLPNVKGKTLFLVIDNLRFDQWKMISRQISDWYNVTREEIYYSILPTSTQYARNALFSGMMPEEIAREHPSLWKYENEQGSKNAHEGELMDICLRRNGFSGKHQYIKVANHDFARRTADNFSNILNNDLTSLVYNFVDMLSHARTEMEVIKELAQDEAAYRSLTVSWFEHSPLSEMLQKAAEEGMRVVLTTDHGTIRVSNPVRIAGQRDTNTNLRYKVGKTLGYEKKEVFTPESAKSIKLPIRSITEEFVFTRNQDFFVYPNNYNHFVNVYQDTFQHGGISLEEMLIPFVILDPR